MNPLDPGGLRDPIGGPLIERHARAEVGTHDQVDAGGHDGRAFVGGADHRVTEHEGGQQAGDADDQGDTGQHGATGPVAELGDREPQGCGHNSSS